MGGGTGGRSGATRSAIPFNGHRRGPSHGTDPDSDDATAGAGRLLWSNFGSATIGRADLAGTGAVQNFITGASQPSGVASDGSFIYWGNSSGGTIGRANLDGTGSDQSFITGAMTPGAIAVDAQHIYWANRTKGELEKQYPGLSVIVKTAIGGSGC